MRYETGFTLTAADTTFSVAAGHLYDDDIEHVIGTITSARIWYRVTGGATWTFTSAGTTPTLVQGAPAHVRYDNGGTLADVGSAQFVAYWFFGTGGFSADDKIMIIMGQRTDSTIANARANNTPESLVLPTMSPEMKLLYRVIYKEVTNAPVYQIG